MENNNNKPWWRDGIIVFVKVSGYIAFPIILASFIGNYFDEKYNSSNKFFFIAIVIAFISTIYLIAKEMKVYKKKLEREEKENK